MSQRTISIVNKSTVVHSTEFLAAVAAVQKQIDRDFLPLWDMGAALQAGGIDAKAQERIYVLDDATQAGALGYHDLESVPVGYVFAKTSMDYGEKWSATFSHEALEQLADPDVNLVTIGTYQKQPTALEFEMCDPVENDEYMIDGVNVSNFILPSWFLPKGPAGTKYDFLGKLKAPVTLSPGGYFGWTRDLKHWQQVTGSGVPHHQRAILSFSRRDRRRKKHSHAIKED